MEDMLTLKYLQLSIEGKSKKPSSMTIKYPQLSIEGKSKKPSSMTNEHWKKLDRKTIATVQQYLTERVYFHVLQEKTLESLWKNLHDLYEGNTLMNKLFLIKRLFNLKMKEGSLVVEHLNELHT